MLQGRELQVNEDDDSYPKDVTHVYAQNHFCDEWNNKRITGGSRLSRIFWEHENLSGLSIIRLIQLL